MLLEGKTAVIYAAGGAIGGAVARAFADISHKLVDESAQILELHLGRHVELSS